MRSITPRCRITPTSSKRWSDPQAIGITALNQATPAVKVVAIAGNALGCPVPRHRRGHRRRQVSVRPVPLPLRPKLTPGQPLEPSLREYPRLVLSREGQEAIASEAHGYLPLNATEIGEELAKLE